MWVSTDVYDPLTCEACGGAGEYPIGDCENGVWANCPACDGRGVIDDEA